MRRTHRVSILLGLALLSSTPQAQGADISAGISADGKDIIVLRGVIETGDAAKVEKLKKELRAQQSMSRSLDAIHLDSPGGSYSEALRIVDVIFPVDPMGTRIDKGAECYSACALIFMAGHTGGGSAGIFPNRKLHYRAKLGFHAPYLKGFKGQFPGEAVETAYKTAIQSLRELLQRHIVSQSLLVEMLGKSPT